jgi:hypothetical protein
VKLFAFSAVTAGIVLYLVAGAVLCEWALRPPKRPVAPNAEARVVDITARDGARLRASLFTPKQWNGDAVLVLHGISDSRGSEIGFAHLFLARGYTVLTPDNRAQGESGGDFVTYGVLEAEDVHRWVSWLIDETHPHRIYGLGESLGGAVLIQSLAVEPRFSAIVAECSYSSLRCWRGTGWPNAFRCRARSAGGSRLRRSGRPSHTRECAMG